MIVYGAGCLRTVFSFSKHPDFWKSIDKKYFCVDLKNIFENFWDRKIKKKLDFNWNFSKIEKSKSWISIEISPKFPIPKISKIFFSNRHKKYFFDQKFLMKIIDFFLKRKRISPSFHFSGLKRAGTRSPVRNRLELPETAICQISHTVCSDQKKT